MECEQAQQFINAFVDQEISADDRALLEAHLQDCAECRETHAAVRTQAEELRRLFEPLRATSIRLADHVVENLPNVPPPTTDTAPARSPGWIPILLSMAIGFLLAVVIFQPWKSPTQIVELLPPTRPVPSQPANFTQFVAATGAIQVRIDQASDWQDVPIALPFNCPSNAAVRTVDDARCELVTSDNCVIRMNGRTEVQLLSPTNVELRRGQIWCRAPADVTLEVTPANLDGKVGDPPSQPPQSAWSCTTPVPANFLTTIQSDGQAQVTTSGGEISLKTRDGSRRLKSGESATITDGQVSTNQQHDQLLALSWMVPLMVGKGHDDSDLKQRVDQLLAGIGASKLSSLYEREIRDLGEYSVLPLLRYLQSPDSRPHTLRRLKAMRIVSDLAPSWAIGDLIGLLVDEESRIRYLAATALSRITQLEHGCPPESWRDNAAECKQAHADWLQWWNSNRNRFPIPKVASRREASRNPPHTAPHKTTD